MARLGVTYQDIATAANQILGQGKQPTIELVRNHLKTGSSTTIANHLRQWRAERDSSLSIAKDEGLPPELVSMVKALWQKLQTEADNKIMAAKQALAQRMTLQQQEIQKYKLNNHRWQKMHEAWLKNKDELLNEKIKLEQEIMALQKNNTILTATIEVQEKQFIEKQERINELNRLHKLAQENLEYYRESARVQRIIDHEKYMKQIQKLIEGA